ncbi:MAG: peptidoglycan recognition family protein [Chthoniobacterales bacterium]
MLAVWSTAVLSTLLHAQVSEADKKKRDAFLKAREEMRTVGSPTPHKPSKAGGKPKAARKKKKGAGSLTKKKADAADDGDKATPSKRKKTSDTEEAPEPTKKPKAEEDEDAPARRAPTTRSTPELNPPRAKPEPTRARTLPPADITIQKSGIEGEQGFASPPPPPPRRGFWSRVFGGSDPTYHYLSRSVIDAIRRAPVQRSRWKFIIVHNSGTRQGNARAFDYYHRHVRRMQNGLAYHFVVGNGTSSGNGEVEVGDRWRRQINGGHVHSDYLNNISLGICLVGDFNHAQPTRAQLDATEELIKYLRERCGPADGRAIPVRPHREMNPPRWATDCPGDAFPYSWFRRF